MERYFHASGFPNQFPHLFHMEAAVFFETPDDHAVRSFFPKQRDLFSQEFKFVLRIQKISKAGTEKDAHRQTAAFSDLFKQRQARRYASNNKRRA